MHRQIRHQGKGVWDSRDPSRLGGFGHIQLLDHFTLLVAKKSKVGAQPGTERGVNLRRVHAYHGELAIIDGEFFLEFHKVAQLHLAFASPVTAVERQNEGEFSDQLGKLYRLAVVIGKFNIWEPMSNALIHALTFPKAFMTLNH